MHIFQSQQLGNLLSMVGKMENLVLNQYCLKVKCHLTFCRTSYATEDPFMIRLKKELLRAYASSSSISVLCVITL
jgi:hypothetical protein